MNANEYIAAEYGTAEAWKPVELTEKQLEHNIRQAFIAGQSYPSEETARKIWDASLKAARHASTGEPTDADFETFYKQLINQ